MYSRRFRVVLVLLLLSLFTTMTSAVARDSETISLLDWNIQVGSDAPIVGNNWTKRKPAVIKTIVAEKPDIICLQEALPEQLLDLEKALPGYDRLGVGRDDGKAKGEHCPIFYRKDRFGVQSSGTFWLSDTPETPQTTWDGPYKRICTWAQFNDSITGTTFWLFNTHFPLNPFAQKRAAALVVTRMSELCPGATRLVTGDFNCGPGSSAWRVFEASELTNTQKLLDGSSKLSLTQHLLGIPCRCIDAVFASDGMTIQKHRVLQNSVDGVWASDHFGISVELVLNSLTTPGAH
ncbi:MAG: endonuclease/exonuclease/phosphatase family protein [Candidatus Obscuribacterales bacterium]